VLAWHVDYWDYLGWKDTFGSPAATERQKGYRGALKLPNLQTPHLYANNRPVAAARIAATVREEAGNEPPFAISGKAELKKGKVRFQGTLRRLAGEAAEGVHVLPVLFVKKAETACTAGENRGRTLVEYFAVAAAGKPVPLATALEKGLDVRLDAPAKPEAGNLGVAILVEDGKAMKTLECAAFDVG